MQQGLFQKGKKVNTAIAGAVRSDHKRSSLQNGQRAVPVARLMMRVSLPPQAVWEVDSSGRWLYLEMMMA